LAKKEVLIAVGLVVLSLAIGIMIGKMRGGSNERDLNASSAELKAEGRFSQQPINRLSMIMKRRYRRY